MTATISTVKLEGEIVSVFMDGFAPCLTKKKKKKKHTKKKNTHSDTEGRGGVFLMPFAATPFRTDWPVLHFSAVVSTAVLSAVLLSVEVDPIKLSQNICSFDHSSIDCDCWHRFVCCSVVKSIPHCLCLLVWTDERSGVVTLEYAIQL